MATPDLAFARERAELLMVDTVKITRDVDGVDDATLDEDSLQLVGPGTPGGPITVYEGKARIHPPQTNLPRSDMSGGATYAEAFYPISVPWSASPIKPHDTVEVVTSANDPYLAGKELVVADVGYHTYLVTRRFAAELRQ